MMPLTKKYHRQKAFLPYLFVLFLLYGLSSCHHQQPAELNVSEVYFDETLASISPDITDPNLFYVGTEDGVVFTYRVNDGTTHRWLTDFDRIYKVVRDPSSDTTPTSSPQEGTIYWVGTRNMGLIQCQLHGDSLVMKKQYALPHTTRGLQYSAYDLYTDPSGLYIATSHGLFYRPNLSDSLQVLYATWEIQSGDETYRPMVASDIKRLKSGHLACASAAGILSIDTRQHKADLLLRGNYTSMACCGDTILALDGDSIKALLPNGRTMGKTKLPYQAYIYFFEPSTRMHYLINGNTVQFVSNHDFGQSLHPRIAATPRPVRPFCHNVIADAPTIGQSLLVTDHALLRLGHHQDVFSDIGNVSLASRDSAYIYYLAGKTLFRQRVGDTTAIQVKDLSREASDVRFMTILNGQLYYADNNNRLFTAPVYSSYLLNSLLSWDHETSPQPDKDLTAIGHDAKEVYVGIRDGLQQVNKADGPLRLKSYLDSAVPVSDPFITVFSTPFSSGSILLGTLNHGLFIGKQGQFTQIPHTESLRFVRDIAILPTQSGTDSLFILTNHRLFCGTKTDLRVSDTITAIRRLAATDNTHIYGFPDFGVVNLSNRQHFFSDIHFNPAACIATGGRVYAGSSCGVYMFDTSLRKQNHMEANYATVQFERRQLFSRTHIGLLLALTILVIVLLWYYLALMAAKRRMLVRIKRLKDIILPLTSAPTETMGAEVEWADQMYKVGQMLHKTNCLEEEVKRLNLKLRFKQRTCIDRLNNAIQDISFDLPTMLIGFLGQQMSIIRAAQWEGDKSYRDHTERLIRGKDNSMEGNGTSCSDTFCHNAVRTILKNAQWMHHARAIAEQYDRYLLIPNVENISQDIYLLMHHLGENAIEKGEQNKNVRPLSREEMISKADDMLSQINKKDLRSKLILQLQAKLAEALTHDSDSHEANAEGANAPQHLLHQAAIKAEELMDVLKSADNTLLADLLNTLICFANAFFRLEAAITLCRAKEVITDFAHKGWVKAQEKEAAKSDFALCVSRFYDAIDHCEDKEVLHIIGLTQKKSGKKKDRFLNEDMLVMMLAGRHKELTPGGKTSMKPILSDDQNEKLLDADKQSLRRARRAFRNLTTTKLNETAKQNKDATDSLALQTAPLQKLKDYGAAHPESFAGWLADIIECL